MSLSYLQETPDVRTKGDSQLGMLPFTRQMLAEKPSGDHFGLIQKAAMGIPPSKVLAPEFMIVSTLGGLRAEDGTPLAVGLHTGHFELGMLVESASEQFRNQKRIPHAR